jgi:hypothetical protein
VVAQKKQPRLSRGAKLFDTSRLILVLLDIGSDNVSSRDTTGMLARVITPILARNLFVVSPIRQRAQPSGT